MKLLLSFALAALAAFGQASPRPAPEFTFQMPDGTKKLLSAYKGKVVIVAFMQTGCPHCQHFAQQLSLYQQEYGPKGVQVIGAVFDNGAKAGYQKFKESYVKGFPLGISDENTVMGWLRQPMDQGYFVPIVAFVNKRGQIVSQHAGDDILFQDPDANIRHILDRLLK